MLHLSYPTRLARLIAGCCFTILVVVTILMGLHPFFAGFWLYQHQSVGGFFIVLFLSLMFFSRSGNSEEEKMEEKEKKMKEDFHKLNVYIQECVKMYFIPSSKNISGLFVKWDFPFPHQVESFLNKVKIQISQENIVNVYSSKETLELRRVIVILLKHIAIALEGKDNDSKEEGLFGKKSQIKKEIEESIKLSKGNTLSEKEYNLLITKEVEIEDQILKAKQYFQNIVEMVNRLGFNIPEHKGFKYILFRALDIPKLSFLDLAFKDLSVGEVEQIVNR